MLAFSPLPVGDQLGLPIVITTDTADPLNQLEIVLDTTTKSGFVTATLTTNDGQPVSQVWNWGSFTVIANDDAAGTIANDVTLKSSEEVSLAGYKASTGLSTHWQATTLAETLDLFNLDDLQVTGGVVGVPSTIAGQFESPTVAPTPATGARISLNSGTGIIGADLDGDGIDNPVVAYTLELSTFAAGIAVNAPILTTGDISILGESDVTVTDTIASTSGDIFIGSLNGDVLMVGGAAFVHAMDGDVVIDSDCGEAELTRICAEENVSITAPQGIIVGQEIRSAAGSVTLLADAGPIVINDIFANLLTPALGTGISVTAAQAIDVQGLMLAYDGGIDITSSGAGMTLTGVVRALSGPLTINLQDRLVQRNGGVVRGFLVSGGSSYTFVNVNVEDPPVGSRPALVRAVLTNGVVTGFVILDGGSGYPPNSRIVATIEGDGEGAEIVLETGDAGSMLQADGDISITAAQGIEMVSEVRSVSGAVSLAAPAGELQINDVFSESDIALTAAQTLSLSGTVQATQGDIAATTLSGNLVVDNPDAKIHALTGRIDLSARRGEALIRNVFANTDLTAVSLGDVDLVGDIQSTTKSITIQSDGTVNNAARINAEEDITIASDLSVSSLGGGIVTLELLSGGINYDWAIVEIAAPAAGGRAGLARATVANGVVTRLELVDPGYGYAPNERVAVTIRGPEFDDPDEEDAQGATAFAVAGPAVSTILAGRNLTLTAGTELSLTNEITARSGSITALVTSGPLQVGDAFAGTSISLSAAQTIDVGGLLLARDGDIDILSEGGGLDIQGSLLAPAGDASVAVAGQIVQRGGSVEETFLLTGGRQYTYAQVIIEPPPGAGNQALARAVITPYDIFAPELGGYISDIVLLDGGWGYPSDTRISATIQGDGEGATVVFETGLVSSTIEASGDVTLEAGDTITLVSTVRAAAGDVRISNTLGDIAVQSITAGSDLEVISRRGDVNVVTLSAGADVTVKADQGVSMTDSLNSVTGDILLETTNGDLTFVKELNFGDNYLVDDTATEIIAEAVVSTKGGSITMTAFNGTIETPYVINANKNVSLTSFTGLDLVNEITAVTGDISLTSLSSLVRVRANLVAEAGSIDIEAQTSLLQETVSGISKIELLSPGPMLDVPPDVTVTIAAPLNGGVPATAFAVIERRARTIGNDDENNEDIIPYEYFIGAIAIINAGRGYEVGEQPVVTITGVAGAEARAYGPTSVNMISAHQDIVLSSGENLELVTKIHSETGDVSIATKAGDITMSAESLLVSAKAGRIDVDAHRGTAEIRQLVAFDSVDVNALDGLTILGSTVSENSTISLTSPNGVVDARHLNAKDDVVVRGFQTSHLRGEVASTTGDVTTTVTAGGIFLDANVVSTLGAIALDAQTFIQQELGTGLERIDVIAAGSLIVQGVAQTPRMIVTVTEPSSGGTQAEAEVIVGRRSLGRDANSDEETVEFFIESVRITNPGDGYKLGEFIAVTLEPLDGEGIQGGVLQAFGPTNLRNITAKTSIALSAIDDIKLTNATTVLAGPLTVKSVSGNIDGGYDTQLLHAVAGSVTLEALAGEATVHQVRASDDVLITAEKNLAIDDRVTAGKTITLQSFSGELTARNLSAAQNISLQSQSLLTLTDIIESSAGDIVGESVAASVLVDGNLVADLGDITIKAQSGITQTTTSGIRSVEVLSGGSILAAGAAGTAPTVTVTIAAPASGIGIAAEAEAVTARRSTGETDAAGSPISEYYIERIVLTSPGSGYAVGEAPLISIVGMPGATARAIGQTGVRHITAEGDVTLIAGVDVLLTTTVRSNSGDITISTTDGSLVFDNPGQLVHAVTGTVMLTALSGAVTVQQVTAGTDLEVEALRDIDVLDLVTADRNIRLSTFAGGAKVQNATAGLDLDVRSQSLITLTEAVVSNGGDILIESSGSSIVLDGSLSASGGGIKATALGEISQRTTTGIQAVEVLSSGSVLAAGGAGVEAPEVTVTIAAPVSGIGIAATAQPVVLRRNTGERDAFDNPISEYYLSSIILTTPGEGYAVGETPQVTIDGMPGATARAIGQTTPRSIVAKDNIELLATGGVLLTTGVFSKAGDIRISSQNGDLELDSADQSLHAEAGSVYLQAATGGALLGQITTGTDIQVTALQKISTTAPITAGGNITLTSLVEGLDAKNLTAQGDITLSSLTGTTLSGSLFSADGDITSAVKSGGQILLAELRTASGSISLQSASSLYQQVSSGVVTLELLSSENYIQREGDQPPAVTVTIAAPVNGGVAATARAILRATPNNSIPPSTTWTIQSLELSTPGTGYAVGENPQVSITGDIPATARAFGPTSLQRIDAEEDVTVIAGDEVTLINPVTAGRDITIISKHNQVSGLPVLHAGKDVTISSFGAFQLDEVIASDGGSIQLTSTNANLVIDANVHAAERVTLNAKTGITQPGGGAIRASELLVTNLSDAAVTLANVANDVSNFAGVTRGSLTYIDANDFETGVVRSGVLGVEVAATNLNLSSAAAKSVVRVVSGLQYRNLSIVAGSLGGTNIGTVEYVTTNAVDNPAAPPTTVPTFGGTLRDMIRYANDNTANYTINGTVRPQPTRMVFDEDNFPVSTITVASALPAFTRPVVFDGGRLENTVASQVRLGVRGTASAATGLAFAQGASGSSLTRVATSGFSQGSSILLTGGDNSITEVYAGLLPNGTAPASADRNRIGIEVAGRTAVRNLIGSSTFSTATANVIGANTAAGVLVRDAAMSTRIYGNIIGEYTDESDPVSPVTFGASNADGIRISGGFQTLIGTPDATQLDLTPSVSNVIANNTSSGIHFLGANAGSFANAHRVQNNRVFGNSGVSLASGAGAGITVRNSKFVIIGGPAISAGNTVTEQGIGTPRSVHGIAITGSTDVNVLGNAIGVDIGTMAANGNTGDGVNIAASQRVNVSSQNVIGGNAGNGIAILTGSSAVTVSGNRIGLLPDDTAAGNMLDGVRIQTALGNTVGAGNLVAYNTNGVSVLDARSTTAATANRVVGSKIFSNLATGVRIGGGSGAVIGGPLAGNANTIHLNAAEGILMEPTVATGSPTNHIIQGNFIGTNSNREVDASLGNGTRGITLSGATSAVVSGNAIMNNATDGVAILGGLNSIIGGTTPAAANLIAVNGGNGGNGIRIARAALATNFATLAAARNHSIMGNEIRDNTSPDDSPVTTGHGIYITGPNVSAITIGHKVSPTSVTGRGNTLVGNRGYGVRIDGAVQQVSFQGNLSFENSLGAFSTQTGANRSAATIVLSAASLRQTTAATQQLTITSRLFNATRGQQYTIDIYANDPSDGDYATLAGYNARRFIGRVNFTATASGTVTIPAFTVSGRLRVGEVITAMVTSMRFEPGSTQAGANAVTADLPGVRTPRF